MGVSASRVYAPPPRPRQRRRRTGECVENRSVRRRLCWLSICLSKSTILTIATGARECVCARRGRPKAAGAPWVRRQPSPEVLDRHCWRRRRSAQGTSGAPAPRHWRSIRSCGRCEVRITGRRSWETRLWCCRRESADGHIELKQPGVGANPNRYRGHDADQWKRFQALPNVIYTDGNSWALFRSGVRVGKAVSLGRLDENGAADITPQRVEALAEMLHDFLYWEPITPSHPRALAELLAPLCRLLRHEVLDAVKRSDSALSSLAADWRQALFPDADDDQFADAYAQTLTYALLLARFDGSKDMHPDRAADVIDKHHGLLAQALRVLGDRQVREDIATGLDILQRVITAVDVQVLPATRGSISMRISLPLMTPSCGKNEVSITRRSKLFMHKYA